MGGIEFRTHPRAPQREGWDLDQGGGAQGRVGLLRHEADGKLTAADIKRRLTTFYKNVSNKEIKFLLNNQPEISFEELYDLLKDNQLTAFDPVKEAFKVYDPNDTGFVDMSVVREFFQNLGYGEISDEDAKIILETADGDKDGRIGLEDFRMMVPFGQPQQQPGGSSSDQ